MRQKSREHPLVFVGPALVQRKVSSMSPLSYPVSPNPEGPHVHVYAPRQSSVPASSTPPYTPQGHPWATPQVAHTRKESWPSEDRPAKQAQEVWMGNQNSQDAECCVQMGRRVLQVGTPPRPWTPHPRSQARAGPSELGLRAAPSS